MSQIMSPTSLEEVHALLALGYDVFMNVLNRDPTWFDLLPEEDPEYKNIVDYMTGVSNWCACCGGCKGCCDCESDFSESEDEDYNDEDEDYNDEDGIEATGSVPDDATGRCAHI